MIKIKYSEKIKSCTIGVLVLVLFVACTPIVDKFSAHKGTHEPQVAQTQSTSQNIPSNTITPSFLAEWRIGNIQDMAWSPDSSMFVVNYWIDGSNSNSFIQAFDVKSLSSKWVVENSLAKDLTFTPDGRFIIESNVFAPFFYWRSMEQGAIVRQVVFQDLSQLEDEDCRGGGQIILTNINNNTAIVADTNDLIGPRTNDFINIRELDLETGKCKNLIQYQGAFDIFDLNSSGSLLVFGGKGKDKLTVVWDMKNLTEVCHISSVDFGRFVPGGDILAVVKRNKIILIDTSTCQETRELNVAPFKDFKTYLALSPDGQQIAVATDSIQIISVATGEILARLPFPKKSVPISNNLFLSGIKFSANGQFLLVAYYLIDGTTDGAVQLWEIKP